MALFYIVAWACASSGLIFLNSHLLNEDGFHYPMTPVSYTHLTLPTILLV